MPVCVRHCSRPKGYNGQNSTLADNLGIQNPRRSRLSQFSLVLSCSFSLLKEHRLLTHGQSGTILCKFPNLELSQEVCEDRKGPGSMCLGLLYGETISAPKVSLVLETRPQPISPMFQGHLAESL